MPSTPYAIAVAARRVLPSQLPGGLTTPPAGSAAAPGVQQCRGLRCGAKDLTVAVMQSVASFGEALARHIEKRRADARRLFRKLRRRRSAHRRFEGRRIAGHCRLVKERRGEYLLGGTDFDRAPAVFLADP